MINVILAFMIVASFLIATVLHEWAHATMAALLGDTTPRFEGRQTLRLSPHIDPVGTLMCVILAFQPIFVAFGSIFSAPVGLGWSKPVKPDPWKMRIGANAGVLAVAWAGPLFNLFIGLLTALVLHFLIPYLVDPTVTYLHGGGAYITGNEPLLWIAQFILVFATVNIGLSLFNLIPLYPLDGYQIVYTLLPSRQAVQFAKSAPYGQFIILALFFLLPFIGRLAGVGDFFLFRLWYYFLTGALNLAALVTGINPEFANLLYTH